MNQTDQMLSQIEAKKQLKGIIDRIASDEPVQLIAAWLTPEGKTHTAIVADGVNASNMVMDLTTIVQYGKRKDMGLV